VGDVYVFDPSQRTFTISQGASLGYGSIPPLGAIPRYGVVNLTEGDVSATVTHNLGITGLGILVSLNWASAYWVDSKSANTFTIYFTVPAIANGKMVWEVSDIMPVDLVTQAADSHTITHLRGDAAIPLFFTPSWPTVVWDSTTDRGLDTAKVYFSAPAPANATLTWRAID
jgi:hypothetical protein